MTIRTLIAAVALTIALVGGVNAQTLDPKLPEYTKTSGVSGNLNSVGSDTLNNLMTLWGEGFNRLYPQVKMQIEGKGSGTAPPAIIEGTAQLGPMSRKMKDKELAAFEKAFGYPPLAIPVAVDGLAVFVHKDSPIEKLTMQEVDALFSATRKGNHTADITSWKALGGEDKPVSLYGRNSASGTYGFFKKVALFKGDFKDTVKEQSGSAAVVQGIAEDIFGIGYSGIGYRTSGVKTVALAKKPGGTYYSPDDSQTVLSGKYPLSRFLYVYVNKAPGKPMDPTTREFLRFVVSKAGQKVVIEDGYLPLSSKMSAKVEKMLTDGAM